MRSLFLLRLFWDIPSGCLKVLKRLYATRGVIGGFVYVDGIVADLGGGSLELSSATLTAP